MKKLLTLALMACGLMISTQDVNAQNDDKSKRPSPPAQVSEKLDNGATITIDYSQPSVKGRTIGKDLEPLEGKVWRTGANEATVFDTDKDITVNSEKLPAGKYGLFTIFNGNTATIIFNKTWNQWGAYSYKQEDDVLRTNVSISEASPFSEKLVFSISANAVSFVWGNKKVEFPVN